MKKNLLLAVAVSLLLSLVSCNDDKNKNNDKKALVMIGYTGIYDLGQKQHIVALDPANIAFRLNVLFSEAKLQGVQDWSPEELQKIKVKVSGEDKLLFQVLFGKNTIERSESDTGLYTLKFDNETSGSGDSKRNGSMQIQTKSKLLGELTEGESWKLYCDSKEKKYILDRRYVVKLPEISNVGGDYLIIPGGAANKWIIKTPLIETYSNNEPDSPGKWTFEVEVSQNEGNQGYSDVMKATFSMTGSGSGLVMQTDRNYHYEIKESLLFKPLCGGDVRNYTGHDKVKSLTPLPDQFPRDEVEVKRVNTENCKIYMHIMYAGWIYYAENGETKPGNSL